MRKSVWLLREPVGQRDPACFQSAFSCKAQGGKIDHRSLAILRLGYAQQKPTKDAKACPRRQLYVCPEFSSIVSNWSGTLSCIEAIQRFNLSSILARGVANRSRERGISFRFLP